VIEKEGTTSYQSMHEHDDNDVYSDKFQTRGVKKSILYI
jgi:hypothetical protein